MLILAKRNQIKKNSSLECDHRKVQKNLVKLFKRPYIRKGEEGNSEHVAYSFPYNEQCLSYPKRYDNEVIIKSTGITEYATFQFEKYNQEKK